MIMIMIVTMSSRLSNMINEVRRCHHSTASSFIDVNQPEGEDEGADALVQSNGNQPIMSEKGRAGQGREGKRSEGDGTISMTQIPMQSNLDAVQCRTAVVE